MKRIFEEVKFSTPKKANNMGKSLLSLGEIDRYNSISFSDLLKLGKILI